MSVHVFGQIGDVAVVEVAIASKAGASAKILNWARSCATSSFPRRRARSA